MAVYAMFVGVFNRAEDRAGGFDYPDYRNEYNRDLRQDYYQDDKQDDAADEERETRSKVGYG